MSNKVFITKYQASIDKDLPVLGQMVIHVMPLIDFQKENDTRIASALGITVSFSTPTELEIVGDSYFTNGTNGESIGKKITVGPIGTRIFFKEGTFDIVVKNKYALTYYLGAIENAENAYGSANKYFDIDNLRYSTDLIYIKNNYNLSVDSKWHNAGKTNGDISSLSNLTNLNVVNFNDTSVSGDISSLSNLTNLNGVHFNNTSVSGDISSLSNLTNLTTIDLGNTSVSGDISSLSNLTNLTFLRLNGTSISGDITDIVTNLTKLVNLIIPKAVTITDAQKKTLTDRGCNVSII